MDKQGRLTRWEEWEVGVKYQWIKGLHVAGIDTCISVNKQRGYVELQSITSGHLHKNFSWQNRYRKIANPPKP